MYFTENFLLYFDTYKFFANLMIYELIVRDEWTEPSDLFNLKTGVFWFVNP